MSKSLTDWIAGTALLGAFALGIGGCANEMIAGKTLQERNPSAYNTRYIPVQDANGNIVYREVYDELPTGPGGVIFFVPITPR